MGIAILVTGGTFDKEYNEIAGDLFFKETHLRKMLAIARCRLATRVEVVMMKDSLNMTERDRARILKACMSCKESRIVVTHGTDTMDRTARYLAKRATGKTLVLTGAIVPYTFGSSDGLFNLGSALAFAQQLDPGVYIAMNGRCFPADRVRKDRRRGVFVASKRAARSET